MNRKTITVRFAGADLDKIEAIAAAHDVTAAQILKAALRSYRPSRKSLDAAVAPTGTAAMDDATRKRISSAGGVASRKPTAQAKKKTSQGKKKTAKKAAKKKGQQG